MDLPVTQEYANRLLRLPLFADMTDEQVTQVIDVATQGFARYA